MDGTDVVPKLPSIVASKCPEFLNADNSRVYEKSIEKIEKL